MKKKFSKILGVGIAFVLAASLIAFAIPVSADPFEPLAPPNPNLWDPFAPTPGGLPFDLWFNHTNITQDGPMAEAINGDVYIHVAGAPAPAWGGNDIFKSTDGARTWAPSTFPFPCTQASGGYYNGGAVVDMVCSSLYADVLYVTDGNYVYKSVNGGVSFTFVAAADLEKLLMGACGIPIVDEPITCIDVGYDGSDKPVVFIGTRNVSHHFPTDHPLFAGDAIVGSVYWIADESFPASWTDLELKCYGCCDISGAPLTAIANEVIDATAAATLLYSGALAVFPIVPGTLVINNVSNDEIFTDNSDGTLTGNDTPAGTGTINYVTGAWSVTFNAQPTQPENIEADYTYPTFPNGVGCWDVYAVGATPDFNISSKAYVVITTDDDLCGTGDVSTRVVSTSGTICMWSLVAELYRDCNITQPFQIIHASRIVFPTYYGTEATLFVGVATANGIGGDVYRVADTFPPSGALDLNVQGYTTGCAGYFEGTNICSLDIENDALIAGAWDSLVTQSPVRVYYSADGGWTWAPSLKDPTGADRCYVLFAGDSALAATRGCDCAVSLSCGATIGTYFNQISLINMNICQVLDLSHAPGYLDGSSTMYVLTRELDACNEDCDDIGGGAALYNIHSLLRWDGTYWERVHSSRSYYATMTEVFLYGTPWYDWVECSPDFNETSCVYLANSEFWMARTLDAGCSWAPLTYPCLDRPTITAWIVVDLETVLAAGDVVLPTYVNIWRTTNHGAQPWSNFAALDSSGTAYAGEGVDFDLSPNIATDSNVLLGDDKGQVFISEDLGMTWAEIEGVLGVPGATIFAGTTNTYVVFDPGYGTADDPGENMIYAAAGTVIGRCDLNTAAPWVLQNWTAIFSTLQNATGIDAAGDTALYVSDEGDTAGLASYTADGTIEVECCIDWFVPGCTCSVDLGLFDPDLVINYISGTGFIDGELLQIMSYNLTCTRAWIAAPDGDDPVWPNGDPYCRCTIVGEVAVRGLDSLTTGYIEISSIRDLTGCTTDDDCDDQTCNATVISSFLRVTSATAAATGILSGVERSLNPMDPMPPVSSVPWVVFERLVNPVTLPNPGTLRHTLPVDSTAAALLCYPDDLWLTAGSNMLWGLDASTDAIPLNPFGYTYRAVIWMWDDVLATPVVQLAPSSGALLALTDEVTLEWSALDLGTLYEIWLWKYCPACPNLMTLDQIITVDPEYFCAAGNCCYTITGLEAGTKYFWMVRVAAGHPFLSKWSAMLPFDTALSLIPYLCSPYCGAEDVILTPNFSWDPVVGATSYEVQVATNEAFSPVLDSATVTVNAWVTAITLDYSSTYYWRARAMKDGVFGAWAVCIFTTEPEPVEPADPVEPIVIPPIEEISPMWIYVIIGIGAVLVIVVIILIAKTRRVS